MTPKEAELAVLDALDGDYISKKSLARKLGFEPTETLERLLEAGTIEAISLSGRGPDHFRLRPKRGRHANADGRSGA
jgi:shikimate kinase